MISIPDNGQKPSTVAKRGPMWQKNQIISEHAPYQCLHFHKTTQPPDRFMSTPKSSPHAIMRWTQTVVIAVENTEHREKQSRVNLGNSASISQTCSLG